MAAGKAKLLSISIPFYNEEENVKAVITGLEKALLRARIPFEIIAVNNASADKTGNILSKLQSNRVKVVHIEKNIGFGNGILDGWKIANGSYLGFTCGDNEVSAQSVVEIFKKLQEEKLDLCKGRRTLREYSSFRKLESFVYNQIFCRLFLGYAHGDINGYPKIMKRSLYNNLKIKNFGAFFDTELMLKAVKLGAKIGDVPVEYRMRKKGKSSVPFYVALPLLVKMIKFKLKG